MPSFKALMAIAALMAGVGAESALSQTLTPSPATLSPSSVTPTVTVPSSKPAPYPTWTAIVDGTSINVPYFANHCGLEDSNDADRKIIDLFREGLGAGKTILGATTLCSELSRVRSEGVENLQRLSVIFYAALDRQGKPPVTKVTSEVCDAIPSSATLAKTDPKERARELFEVSKTSTELQTGLLSGTSRGCFLGLSSHDANGYSSGVAAFIPVNGKIVMIVPFSVNGLQPPAQLDLASRLVNQIGRLNSNKSPG